MSAWQDYCVRMAHDGCTVSGIFDVATGDTWAYDKVQASKDEIMKIVSMIRSGTPEAFTMASRKFMPLGIEKDNFILGKCLKSDCDEDKVLICIRICNRCLVAGGFSGPSERDVTTRVTEELSRYLKNSGY